MPGPIAPLVGLLLGIAFAWAAREDLAQSEKGPLATRAVLLVAAYGLLVHGPITGYFLTYAPDWFYAYLVDSRQLPATVEVFGVLLAAATPLIAFAAAARVASRRRGAILFRWSAGLLIVILGLSLAFGTRWATDATYTQFRGDFGTRAVAGGDLGYALLWMNSVMAVAIAWMFRSLRSLGRASQHR